MPSKAWKLAAAHLASAALIVAPFTMTGAEAGGFSQSHGGTKPGCNNGGGGITINKPVTINKNINIYKPTTINKNINIYKPVTINKNINIYKPVTITKNIDASKNITINKSIVINKGGAGAEASAWAQAWASAQASASASANVVVYNGSNEYVTVNNHLEGGTIGQVETTGRCQMQEASVVKAIHAVCIAPDGRELPASHMIGDTWIQSGYEGEILRCIPGAHLKIVIGDVVQSDQGMAGMTSGQTIECSESEALGHFKDGMLKCTPKVWVKDCTERTNLRRWGTGDMFFTYRSTVCVSSTRTVAAQRELDVSGMSLDGGVGEEQ